MKKNTFYSFSLAALLAATLLTGCEEEDVMLIVPKVSISLDNIEVSTRADNDVNNTTFLLGYAATENTSNLVTPKSIFGIFADNGSYTYSAVKNYGSTKSSKTISTVNATNDAIYFKPGATDCHMYGWYPYISSYVSSGTYNHQVLADQSSNFNYALSDLLIAQPITHSRTKSGNTWTYGTKPDFTLKHAMSKIILTVTPGTGVTRITGVRLVNVNRQVPVTLTKTSNQVTAVGVGTAAAVSGSTTVTLYSNSTGFSASKVLAAVIPPRTGVTADFIEVDATTTLGSGTVKFSVSSQTFTGDRTYSATLNITQQQVGTTVDISGWGANTNLTLGGDGRI